MKRFILTTLVVVLASVGTASARTPLFKPHERAALELCAQGHVRACIKRAAIHRGVSYSWLLSTAYCESRFNPHAVNGQYVGLFQFGPDAWSRAHYAGHSPFDPKWASLGAAYMFSIGHSHEWQCA